MNWYAVFFAACLCTAAVSGCSKNPMFIAHRGASHLAPENTVASVQLAWDLDVDASEIDVYITPDKRIVAIHDKTTKRTTGVDMEVSTTPSGELRKLDAGSFKSTDYEGEKIPYLEEIIATVPASKTLFIEVKCGPEIVPLLKEVIEKSGKKSNIVLIAFDFETIAECKKAMADVPAYWLKGTDKNPDTDAPVLHDISLVEKVISGNLDGIDVNYAGINEQFVKAVHDRGLKIYAWTVNDVAEARRLVEMDVDGITTDRPDWLKKQMREK